MGTTFDTIHDFALISFKDWRIDQIYSVSPTNFKTLMDGYMFKAIPLFDVCKQDLTAFNVTSRQFTATLTLNEQIILSNLEVLVWMDSQVLDVRQMSLFLSDTDFRSFSQAQNLAAKIEAQNILREKVNQDMIVYSLKQTDWTAWAAGNYE